MPGHNLSYSFLYGQLIVDQFKSAGISLVSNNWSDIYDFTKAPDEINWSLLDHVSLLLNHMLSGNIYYWQSEFDLPNNNTELLEVGLNIETDKSVTPATVGVAQRPQGQVSNC